MHEMTQAHMLQGGRVIRQRDSMVLHVLEYQIDLTLKLKFGRHCLLVLYLGIECKPS